MYNLLKAQARPGETASDDADEATLQKEFDDYASTGQHSKVTEQMIQDLVPSKTITSLPSTITDINAQLAKDNGYMNIDGKPIRIVESGPYSGDRGFMKIEYPINSGKYFYTVTAKKTGPSWFSAPPKYGDWKNEVSNPLA